MFRQFIKDKTVVNRYWEALIINDDFPERIFKLNYPEKKIRKYSNLPILDRRTIFDLEWVLVLLDLYIKRIIW
jgi:hypothetical protein